MKKIIAPFLFALVLAGCVPSVNPLYTDKDLIFEPALTGVWQGEHEKESWTFEKSGEKKYKLLHSDENGKTAEFIAHLVKLKEQLFLDIVVKNPGDEKWDINEMAGASIIMKPGHFFFKVSQLKPTLKLSILDFGWLNDLLKENPKAIRHERICFNPDDPEKFQLILTAETKELQKFILDNVGKAFGDKPAELRRKENPAAKPEEKSGKK